MASGAEGSRTLDLLNAIQALSQLSYGPTGGKTGGGVSIPRPSRVGQRDAASLPEVAARVDRRAVDAHLVVKVRPGGTARRADGADRLAAMHLLALAHVERGEMAVERVEPTAVIDDHEAAVARVAPGEDHLAVAGRRHRKAVLRRDVDAGVHLAPLAVGGRADAEGRGDEPAHGPERRHAAAHLLAAVLHQHGQHRERVAGGRRLPVEPGELLERAARVLRHDRHAAVEHRRHVDQWTRLRAALLHVRQAARLGAALAQRRRSAREAIDPARHLGHLPALAGDQLAPVREPRAEPRHLVAQRGAPLLGLPHLLGGSGSDDDHQRGGKARALRRARDDGSVRHERSPRGGVLPRYATSLLAVNPRLRPLGPPEKLLGVLPDLVRQALAPQHARQLRHTLGRGQRACRRDGTLFLHLFGDDDVVLGEGRDQRQVGDTEDLAAAAELAELAADDFGDRAADAGIDLVEDERGTPLVGGGEGLEREHDARQLAARGHAGERARLLARVGREEELDLVPALGAERAPLGLGETRLEARAGERQRLELRDESARQIARLPPPLDREPARPLGGGAPGRLGRGLELYHRLATARDAVHLGHPLVAPADQVLDRAGELALQARELRQALLHRLQATRVGGQLAGIAAEALAGLLQLGERALEEGAHGLEARVEPGRLAQRDERAAEYLDHRALAGVEALLRARRQHGQALGVHQAGALGPERLLLARHESGAHQLLGLRAQHLGPLARRLVVGVRRRDRLARRDQPAVAGGAPPERC